MDQAVVLFVFCVVSRLYRIGLDCVVFEREEQSQRDPRQAMMAWCHPDSQTEPRRAMIAWCHPDTVHISNK